MNIIRASCEIARRRTLSYGLRGVRVRTSISMEHSGGLVDIIYSRVFFVSTMDVEDTSAVLCINQPDDIHSWIGGSSL